MKNKLLTLKAVMLSLVLVGAVHSLNAQNYLINENFDNFPANLNGTSANSWTGFTLSGDSAVDRWVFNNSIGYDIASPLNGQVALADCYMGGFANTGSNNTNSQNLTLVSPTVSTVGLTNLTLTYDELYLQLNSSGTFVEVSTNGGTSWTTVFSTGTGGFFPNSRSINLASYTGNASFTIRFRWTTPASTTHGYWMLDNVKLFSRYANDVGVEALIDPKNNACPDPNQNVSLRITNFGTSSASNISVNMNVSGGASGNFSTSVATLAAGTSVNVFTGNTVNTTSGGNINFTSYTTYAGDQTTTNDTLDVTIVTAPTPTDPSGNAIVQCGVGPVTLTANAVAGEETVWYEDGTTSTSVGSGNPFLYNNTVYASRDFYAENTRNLPSVHSTGLTGVYRYNTNAEKAIYFDITTTNEIVIDSFASNFAYNGRYICSVYYRAGTYLGYQTNKAAFTLLKVDTVDANVLGQPAFVSLDGAKFRVGSGQSYGFAITARAYTGSAIPAFAFKLGTTNNVANEDMSIYANDVSETAFTNQLTGYSGDVLVHYQKVCKSQRKPISVVIIPKPTGLELIEGTPNNGAYRSGTIGEPDVARLGDTFTYEVQPITGYTNADYGTSWTITDLSMKTLGGAAPVATDTATSMPGTNNGTLTYIPSGGVDTLYRIDITVLDMVKNCDTTVTRYLLVGADPFVQFSTQAICEGDETSFTNNSSIASGSLSYMWYFGDGDSTDTPNPKHTYALAGSYNVRLIGTSNYGFVSIYDSTIQVFEIPQADFSVNNVCEGASHQFADASYIPSIGTPIYTWDFGDGGAGSSSANPSNTYSMAGTYLVNMHVDVNGCFSEKQRYVTLAPRAVPGFTVQTLCNNKEASFINTSTLQFGTYGTTYKFGDGSVSGDPNAKHKYATFGSIDATLIVTTDLGCIDSVTNTVTLIESPNADFSLSSNCASETIQVNNLTNVPSPGSNGYVWSFGNGQTSTSDNPVISYPGHGSFVIQLIATNTNGCVDTLERTVIMDVKPIAAFNAKDVCEGTAVEFKNNTVNTTGTITYVWDFANGQFSSAGDTSIVYAAAGSYDVALYARTGNGCVDTAMKTINVNPIPNSGFTVVSAQAGDGTMFFDAPTGSGLSYQWFLGDGGKENSASFNYTYKLPGNYTARLVVISDKGCRSESTQSVSVTPTGIHMDEYQITAYPNPSNGILKLDLTAMPEGVHHVSIRDMQGKVVRKFDLEGARSHELNLEELTPSTYLLDVLGAGKVYTIKVSILP